MAKRGLYSSIHDVLGHGKNERFESGSTFFLGAAKHNPCQLFEDAKTTWTKESESCTCRV